MIRHNIDIENCIYEYIFSSYNKMKINKQISYTVILYQNCKGKSLKIDNRDKIFMSLISYSRGFRNQS